MSVLGTSGGTVEKIVKEAIAHIVTGSKPDAGTVRGQLMNIVLDAIGKIEAIDEAHTEGVRTVARAQDAYLREYVHSNLEDVENDKEALAEDAMSVEEFLKRVG